MGAGALAETAVIDSEDVEVGIVEQGEAVDV